MKVEYENRLLLFLDILGFRNLIDNSVQDNEVLNKIYQAIHEIQTLTRGRGYRYKPETNECKIHIFTWHCGI